PTSSASCTWVRPSCSRSLRTSSPVMPAAIRHVRQRVNVLLKVDPSRTDVLATDGNARQLTALSQVCDRTRWNLEQTPHHLIRYTEGVLFIATERGAGHPQPRDEESAERAVSRRICIQLGQQDRHLLWR